MAVTGTPWQRGDGVITHVSGLSGNASTIKYDWTVAWVLGGVGVANGTATKPKRPIPDDTFVTAAAVGDPCTVTVNQDGTVNLFVFTEDWGFTDCTP